MKRNNLNLQNQAHFQNPDGTPWNAQQIQDWLRETAKLYAESMFRAFIHMKMSGSKTRQPKTSGRRKLESKYSPTGNMTNMAKLKARQEKISKDYARREDLAL